MDQRQRFFGNCKKSAKNLEDRNWRIRDFREKKLKENYVSWKKIS